MSLRERRIAKEFRDIKKEEEASISAELINLLKENGVTAKIAGREKTMRFLMKE